MFLIMIIIKCYIFNVKMKCLVPIFKKMLDPPNFFSVTALNAWILDSNLFEITVGFQTLCTGVNF